MNGESDYDLALSDPEDEDLQDAAIVREPPLPMKENLHAVGFARNFLNSVPSNGKLETDFRNSDALRKALADLAEERKAREKLEEEKKAADLAHSSSFSRLKFLAQEACKQRDESLKSKEEALKSGEAARKEMEKAAEVLNAEADRIIRKLSINQRVFETDPKTPKLSGLPSVVYAVKRKLEVAVDEVIKERDASREMADQRNIEHAIAMSELEAVISSLKEEKLKSEEEIKNWQKSLAHKDEMLKQVLSNVEECEKRIRELESATAKEKQKSEELKSELNNAAKDLDAQKLMSDNYKKSMEEAQRSVKQFLDMTDDLARQVVSMIPNRKTNGKILGNTNYDAISRHLSIDRSSGADTIGKAFSKAFEVLVESNSKSEATFLKEKSLLEKSIQDLTLNKKSLEVEVANLTLGNEEQLKKIEHISKEMNFKEKEVLMLEEKLNEVLEKMENDNLEKKVVELELSLQKAERENERVLEDKDEMQAKLEKSQQTINELEKQCDLALKERDTIHSRVIILEEEVSSLSIQLQEKETLLISERDKVAKLENKLREKEGELSNLIALAEELKSDLSSSLTQIEEGKLEIERLKIAFRDENSAKNGLQENFDAAVEQLISMKDQVEMMQREAEEWKERVHMKQEIVSSALLARAAAEESLTKSDQRIRELRLRVDDLERQLTQSEPSNYGHGGREAEPGCFGRLKLWVDTFRFLYWRRSLASAQGFGSGSTASNRELISEMETLLEPLI